MIVEPISVARSSVKKRPGRSGGSHGGTALGGGHRKQRGDAAGAGGFAEHGHRIMVSAESGDVLLHPAQRCNLIEEPTVGRSTREGREPFGVQPVVERHHDDLSAASAAPSKSGSPTIRRVSAAMDPHHDGHSGGGDVG